MISYIIVGAQGTGKSTLTKKFIEKASKKSLLIYDVNAEYKDYYSYDFVPIQTFLNVCLKAQNAVMVFEEATIFFTSKQSNKEMRELIVRRRHTKNAIFLLFHSVRSIPKNIYEICNYITILKTNDSPEDVHTIFRDERLTKAVKELKEYKKEEYHSITISILE